MMRLVAGVLSVATLVACSRDTRSAGAAPAATTAPAARITSETTGLNPPSTDLASLGIPAPALRPPLAPVEQFGAVGDGVTDDGPAITRAIHSLPAGGGTVVFTAGKVYAKRAVITVDRPDVALWGNGAILYTTVTEAEVEDPTKAGIAVYLNSPHDAVYGLTFKSNLGRRPKGNTNVAGLVLASEGQSVIGNRFEETGVGVMARKAHDFVIASNVVYRTLADGIHITSSTAGIVVDNIVRQTGDDMIAIVDYGAGAPTTGDVLIEGNDVSDQYWGRGITVVGGKNVTIRGNHISRTARGAGVLINSETSYKTANIENVVVENNVIEDVQTVEPSFNLLQNSKKTGQGGIDIYGQGEQTVKDVVVRNNRINGTFKDGIFVRGNSCEVTLANNALTRVGVNPIDISLSVASGAAPSCRISCSGNTGNGGPATHNRCAAEQTAPATGVAQSTVEAVVADIRRH